MKRASLLLLLWSVAIPVSATEPTVESAPVEAAPSPKPHVYGPVDEGAEGAKPRASGAPAHRTRTKRSAKPRVFGGAKASNSRQKSRTGGKVGVALPF